MKQRLRERGQASLATRKREKQSRKLVSEALGPGGGGKKDRDTKKAGSRGVRVHRSESSVQVFGGEKGSEEAARKTARQKVVAPELKGPNRLLRFGKHQEPRYSGGRRLGRLGLRKQVNGNRSEAGSGNDAPLQRGKKKRGGGVLPCLPASRGEEYSETT